MAEKILQESNTCPKCNAQFHCSKSKRCWCFEVDLSTDALEEIEKNYDSCLCPKCLKGYSTKSFKN